MVADMKSNKKREIKFMKNEKINLIDKLPVRAVSGTHYARVLNHLKVYGSINSLEAITLYGNTRLSATIHLLRKDGYNIESVNTEGKNRYGDTTYFANYVLKEEK